MKDAPRVFFVMIQGLEDGALSRCDGIEYEGKLWLVPNWIDIPGRGLTKPARLIRFDQLDYQPMTGHPDRIEYFVRTPMTKDIFDLRTPKVAITGYEVVDLPEVAIPRSGARLN